MRHLTFAGMLLATTALAGAARAETVAALVEDDTLVMVDTEARKVVKTTKLSGAVGKVVGIDVRPADGMLYALSSDGVIWTLDGGNGRAVQKSKLDMPLGERHQHG